MGRARPSPSLSLFLWSNKLLTAAHHCLRRCTPPCLRKVPSGLLRVSVHSGLWTASFFSSLSLPAAIRICWLTFVTLRTVSSLTLEDIICARYSSLLQNHVTEAYKSARLKTLIFALSDCKSTCKPG